MGADKDVPGAASLEDKADHFRLTLDWQGLLGVSEKFGDSAPTKANLLKGEAFLELGDYKKAEKHLSASLQKSPDNEESHILMARLLIRKENYKGALEHTAKVKMPTVTDQMMADASDSRLSERTLRKQLEAQAIKAQCDGYLGDTEKGLEDALVVLDVIDKFFQGNIPHKKSLFRHVLNEVVVAIGPVPMTSPNYDSRIDWLRKQLKASRPKQEDTRLKRTYLLRSLGRILAASCAAEYRPMDKSGSEYVPLSHSEESGLALLLAEDNFQTLSEFDIDGTIYDDIVVSLSQSGQLAKNVAALERGVVRCRQVEPLWSQLARALSGVGRHENALSALKECITLSGQENSTYYTRAAEQCVYFIKDYAQAVDLAEKGFQLASTYDTSKDGSMSGVTRHALHILGVSLAQWSTRVSSMEERKTLQQSALDCLVRASAADPTNPYIAFHLAAHYANIREISKASAILASNLTTLDTNPNVWLLFVLVLSAARRYAEALTTCRSALHEHPDCANLQFVMGLLLEHNGASSGSATSGYDQALAYYRELAQAAEKTNLALSVKARLEEARLLIEYEGPCNEARAILDSVMKNGRGGTAHLADTHYLAGYYEERRGAHADALGHLQTALTHDVEHVKSLVGHARLHEKIGNDSLALTYARSAARAESTSYEAWHHAGILFKKTGEDDAAAEALIIAAELELANPVAHFGVVDWSPFL